MSAAPLKVKGSRDWLADIFDAMGSVDIPAMEMAEQLELKDGVLFSLETQNPGETGAVDVVDTVGGDAGGTYAGSKQSERDTQNSTGAHEPRTESTGKMKKSQREKRRRDALNDHFMGLSALLEPGSTEALKIDKVTIVTEAAKVIMALRRQLQEKSDTFKEIAENNAALMKERESILQDKQKIEYQLACFMSSMPFASPTLMGGQYHHPGAAAPGAPAAMPKPGQLSMPNMMFASPPLVVQTTTADEDAKLRAPLA